MKGFLYIWSLYLLVLGCLPCVDLAVPGYSYAGTFTAAEHKSEHDDHAGDLCSPLCQCACCGCVTISVKSISLSLPIPVYAPVITEAVFNYQAPLTTGVHTALFRPPIVSLG